MAKPDANVISLRAFDTPLAKVEFHIKRFKLALEQCTKGDKRKAELQKNLDYWVNVKNTITMKPEA